MCELPVALNVTNIENGVGVSWTEPQSLIDGIIHLHVPTTT